MHSRDLDALRKLDTDRLNPESRRSRLYDMALEDEFAEEKTQPMLQLWWETEPEVVR